MARTKKSGATSVDVWDLTREQEVVVPKDRPTVSQRVKKLVLWTILLMFPLQTLVTFASMQATQKAQQASPEAGAAKVSSPGRFVATRAIEQWLAATPAPIPGGRIVSWDGATTRQAPLDANGNPTADWLSSTENFTIADASGNQFTTAVQVALDPRGGAKTISGPSLLPVATAASDEWVSNTDPWPGLDSSVASDPVNAAIGSWAAAFTGGDADALRLAVGDPNPTHGYVPLSGMQLDGATIDRAAKLADPSRLLVRAVLTFADRQADPTSSIKPEVSTVIYDVLLARADTAAPAVVAWGPPGSGPSLVPFMNAVTAVAREPLVTPSPSSSSPTSEGSK